MAYPCLNNRLTPIAMVLAGKYADKLVGARVLVIGGTSGFGYCVAEAALQFGAILFVCSSKQGSVDKAVKRLKQDNPDNATNIQGQVCDLMPVSAQEGNLTKVLDWAAAAPGKKLDHVVFTAGDRISFIPTKDFTPSYLETVSATRFAGVITLAKLAPSNLNLSSKSSITVTGGTLATKPVGRMGSVVPAYTAAIEGLARGLAKELAPIRTNAVAPGAVASTYIDNMPPEARDGIYKAFREATVLEQVGQAEDVAEAYLYSMRDGYLTGAVINTNGGTFLI